MTTPLTTEDVQQIVQQEIVLTMLRRIEAKLDLIYPDLQSYPQSLQDLE